MSGVLTTGGIKVDSNGSGHGVCNEDEQFI